MATRSVLGIGVYTILSHCPLPVICLFILFTLTFYTPRIRRRTSDPREFFFFCYTSSLNFVPLHELNNPPTKTNPPVWSSSPLGFVSLLDHVYDTPPFSKCISSTLVPSSVCVYFNRSFRFWLSMSRNSKDPLSKTYTKVPVVHPNLPSLY